MTTGTGQPYTGPLSFDLTAIAPILIDQPPGTLRGMRRDQPGIDDVIHELAGAVKSNGTEAGVAGHAYQRFLDSTEKLTKLRLNSAALLKMAEVLVETEATYENEREQALSQTVDAVKSTAKRSKNPAILAPFEKSIRYTQQASTKAVEPLHRQVAIALGRHAVRRVAHDPGVIEPGQDRGLALEALDVDLGPAPQDLERHRHAPLLVEGAKDGAHPPGARDGPEEKTSRDDSASHHGYLHRRKTELTPRGAGAR